MEYLLIFISAIFVNNIVLSQFLGICPFLGVSKKIDTAIGMGGAIAFVLTLLNIAIMYPNVRNAPGGKMNTRMLVVSGNKAMPKILLAPKISRAQPRSVKARVMQQMLNKKKRKDKPI